MKQKLLLTLFIASINLAVNAQKSATYAITGSQKGGSNWTEVRLVDPISGQELKTVFKNSEETQPLNARTGKPVKKNVNTDNLQTARFGPEGKSFTFSGDKIIIKGEGNGSSSGDNVRIIRVRPGDNTAPTVGTLQASKLREEAIQKIITESRNSPQAVRVEASKIREVMKDRIVIEKTALVTQHTAKVAEHTARAKALTDLHVNTDVHTMINVNTNGTTRTYTLIKDHDGKTLISGNAIQFARTSPSLDKPFSTYSAACAYDKKHDRLYYTPMGIAQLRYIDLKSKTPQVFYFEDEQFGALRGRGDISNQITRMVIGADGNGYALTNNADHLIRFTTDKKATITDLGALTDDAANGKFTVRSAGGYGGDIIAAKNGDLYLITANRNVFQIDIKSMVATYKGAIQGLPRGYSTNGAAVEDGSMVLVNSSNSTEGYYHFDMNTLAAEKVSTSQDVYNASDLANANLLTVKKETKEEQAIVPPVVPAPEQVVEMAPTKNNLQENVEQVRLAVYPNPVTNGTVNLLLDNYAPGRYLAKLIDVSGKQLSSRNFTISNKSHKEPYPLGSIVKGNYLIQLYDQTSKGAGVVKLVVQ